MLFALIVYALQSVSRLPTGFWNRFLIIYFSSLWPYSSVLFYTCLIIISFRTVMQRCRHFRGCILTMPLQWITTMNFLSKHIANSFQSYVFQPVFFLHHPCFFWRITTVKNIFRLITSSPPWSSSYLWRWRTRCQCSLVSPSWPRVSTGGYKVMSSIFADQ